MASYYRLSSSTSTYIANDSPYPDERSFYSSESGDLSSGGGGSTYRERTGLAVTVSIPPTLRAFKYPNMVKNQGTPYASSTDINKLAENTSWYNAIKTISANRARQLVHINREISKTRAQYNVYKTKKNKAGMAKAKARLDDLNKQKEFMLLSNKNNVKLLNIFSTEFEISDFITSLSWSSSGDNNFINVSISLDNLQGIFNYLPEAAKITIWRRKTASGSAKLNSGKWYRYITCYVTEKETSIEARSNKLTITCSDRAGFLQSQISKKQQWIKGKKSHKKGWTPRDITIDICKREGIPYDSKKIPSYFVKNKVVKMADGRIKRSIVKVYLPRIEYKPDSKELNLLISGAWNQSLAKLPKKDQLDYSMHMRQGFLVVEFLTPPGQLMTQTDPEGQKQLAVFDDENIETSTSKTSINPESVYTVLVAKGTYQDGFTKNAKGKKIRKTKPASGTFHPSGNRGKLVWQAYGKRTKNKTFPHVFKNKEEFRTAAQAWIDGRSRPVLTLSIDARGPLGIWPRYYVTVISRQLGIKGNIKVDTVNYSVDNGMVKVGLELGVTYKHYSSGEAAFTYPPIDDTTEASADWWY